MAPTPAPPAAAAAAAATPKTDPKTLHNIGDRRLNYDAGELIEEHVDATDPMAQFRAWYEAAEAAWHPGLPREANAMSLATADARGRPHCRIVLLKHYDADGFVFYTNHTSRKGVELAENPYAALVFLWDQRSVRVEGPVVHVGDDEAAAYFASRPRGSQIGAWASKQSQPISGRGALAARFEAAEARFAPVGLPVVPKPPFWGGYRVVPERIEFWHGRPCRMHDRLVFTRSPVSEAAEATTTVWGPWSMQRLMP
ncbi:hypothetical protein CXG81DRAFT_11330 [Caulochytrium protostelioides]|uniref:pyridoxal 5'-phosphate synthase n=1 Tax=Caulochytrium protostelioides TaxID=1555241 RepID=A0A4P9X9H7_9FUNG|nr:hypothetical protein CXG81DRAFT_11330 [Caulochytrium protostelioides]|eukprot:RKP01997.1 hypothetical protein CXG81DRAFT_11330 [Caulochytrium protostelioides]